MTIKLRSKAIKNGMESLYLDYYFPNQIKKRKRQSLDLKIYSSPQNKYERAHNKKIKDLAESIRSKALLEIQHKENGFYHLINKSNKLSLIEYFENLLDRRINNNKQISGWAATLKHIKTFDHNLTPITSINPQWLEGFKSFLSNQATSRNNKKLSEGSKYAYFGCLRTCLNIAVQEDIISSNPCSKIKGFKLSIPKREFLTLEELKSVINTKCENPLLKQAFIFSCLTGLRWSDINLLKWNDIQYSPEYGNYIRFKQKKTNAHETLPVNEQALEYLPPRKENTQLIFSGLRYSAWNNLKLQQWVMQAGISKTITFHCARHTYATLQLTMGTDLFTVSKLLGHKEIRTTQVYAKIVDKKKVDAVNNLPNLK